MFFKKPQNKIGFFQKRVSQYDPDPEEVMRKKWMDRILYNALISILFLAAYFTVSTISALVISKKINCADFKTHASAQRAFERDPIKYKSLDGDKNGVACESLK